MFSSGPGLGSGAPAAVAASPMSMFSSGPGVWSGAPVDAVASPMSIVASNQGASFHAQSEQSEQTPPLFYEPKPGKCVRLVLFSFISNSHHHLFKHPRPANKRDIAHKRSPF